MLRIKEKDVVRYERELEHILLNNKSIIDKTKGNCREENLNIAGSVGLLRSFIEQVKSQIEKD